MQYPTLQPAEQLETPAKRLLISAYGFEDRSLAWASIQSNARGHLSEALVFRYEPGLNVNRVDELRDLLRPIGVIYPREISYDMLEPERIEGTLEHEFKAIHHFDEIVLDITAMTKYLILICLSKLTTFTGTLRIVYAEASNYAPTEAEYNNYKVDSKALATFPSQGFKNILRAKCLSSIRMQGQPVAVVAFTSFNEQLVRHMLGTISPYRLIFINGQCPHPADAWRNRAMQEIHKRLINDYRSSNPIDPKTGDLLRKASTLRYTETIEVITKIYEEYGNYERIIIAATGSKMQTVGLFFAKIKYSDLHIEYPTPNSYFFDGLSRGVKEVHELIIKNFSSCISAIQSLQLFENK